VEQEPSSPTTRGGYQIIDSSSGGSASNTRLHGFWERFKALLIGVEFLIAVVTVLVVAVIFGSIFVVVLWVCLVVAIASVIVRLTWRMFSRRHV
jgi:hypothetical protein